MISQAKEDEVQSDISQKATALFEKGFNCAESVSMAIWANYLFAIPCSKRRKRRSVRKREGSFVKSYLR